MEEKEFNLTQEEALHKKLMNAVLEGVADTPLVLKGGTALMMAYGLDRFSEDLDFDAPFKLNLESRIRRNVPYGIGIIGLDLVKNTESVTRYRVRYQSEDGPRTLKVEVSYRTPALKSDVQIVSGVRVYSLTKIIDQKLNIAHDGQKPRTAIRDLYDLDFISRKFTEAFTPELAARLAEFSAHPDALISRYQQAWLEDNLVRDRIGLEELALRLHYTANAIYRDSHQKTTRPVSQLKI